MVSLLQLQPPVVLRPAAPDAGDAEHRALSIPATRLADARSTAAATATVTAAVTATVTSDTRDMVLRHKVSSSPGAFSVQGHGRGARRPHKGSSSVPRGGGAGESLAQSMWRALAVPRAAAAPSVSTAIHASTGHAHTNSSANMTGNNNTSGDMTWGSGGVEGPAGAVLRALMCRLSDKEQLLHTLLPPRRCGTTTTTTTTTPTTMMTGAMMTGAETEWDEEEDGAVRVQFVSAAPAGRAEVSALHAQLLSTLRERGARTTGLCPIRRAVHAELFDELIRQVTVEEPARGVLLLRVRDEFQQTLAAHHALFTSGVRAAQRRLRSQLEENPYEENPHEENPYEENPYEENPYEGSPYEGSPHVGSPYEGSALMKRIAQLEAECGALRTRRRAAEAAVALARRVAEEDAAAAARARQEETAYFRRTNQQLTQRLKAETERVNAGGVHGFGGVSPSETTTSVAS